MRVNNGIKFRILLPHRNRTENRYQNTKCFCNLSGIQSFSHIQNGISFRSNSQFKFAVRMIPFYVGVECCETETGVVTSQAQRAMKKQSKQSTSFHAKIALEVALEVGLEVRGKQRRWSVDTGRRTSRMIRKTKRRLNEIRNHLTLNELSGDTAVRLRGNGVDMTWN